MPNLSKLLDEATQDCEDIPALRDCYNATGWKSLAYMKGERELSSQRR